MVIEATPESYIAVSILMDLDGACLFTGWHNDLAHRFGRFGQRDHG
jgi:uncharacterized protein (DUF924 family)